MSARWLSRQDRVRLRQIFAKLRQNATISLEIFHLLQGKLTLSNELTNVCYTIFSKRIGYLTGE